jgi:hypothetical protein
MTADGNTDEKVRAEQTEYLLRKHFINPTNHRIGLTKNSKNRIKRLKISRKPKRNHHQIPL